MFGGDGEGAGVREERSWLTPDRLLAPTHLKFGRRPAETLRMRRVWRGRDGWAALVALLVASVGGAGIAAAASTAGANHMVERSVLTAAGVTDSDGAPLPTSSTTTTQTTTAPPATAPPATTTAAAKNLATTVPVGVPLTSPSLAVRAPSGAPATTATQPTTTTSIPVSPSSWSVDQHGISVRVRIDPAVPRAGQPVRVIIDTSSSTGTFCCLNLLTVNGVQEQLPKGGPAVDVNGATITSTHEEQTWPVPDSGWLNLIVDATSLGGPPVSPTQPAQPVSVRLIGNTPIVA